jgi:hypothetical protein
MPHPQTTAGSTVIAFPPLGARGRRVAREEGSEPGTVLLFTGVRYERMDDDAGEAQADDVSDCRRDDIWS